jgi:hypothetical protein
MQESAQLIRAVGQMVGAGTPLSFYDALMVVQRARCIDELTDAALHWLIHMHDLPRTTDGARAILADFLRAQAERHADQRKRAARPLTLGDSGKTARATAGARVTLELEERRGQGYRWRVDAVRGPGSCGRRGVVPAGPPRGVFDVKLTRPGVLALKLAEDRPPEIADDDTKPRTFELRVIVEAKA